MGWGGEESPETFLHSSGMINYLPWWSVKYLTSAVGWAELLSESPRKAPPAARLPSEGCEPKLKRTLLKGKRHNTPFVGKGVWGPAP